MTVAGPNNYIQLPYHPRPFWEKQIHPMMDKYRYSVIVAHRRFGKTDGSLNQMIKRAIQNTEFVSPKYFYVAPLLKQAKNVAWERLKRYTSTIPNRKVNEAELWVELPSYYEGAAGARIGILGADNPDSVRGDGWDGVIIDEYAQIKQELWGEIVRPALADRHGWAIFIGTPKGANQFYDLYLKAQTDPRWFAALYTIDDTNILSPQEIQEMKEDMTEDQVLQELYCDFNIKAFNKLISLDVINKAMAKGEEDMPESEYNKSPKVLGVDVARFGDDSSVLFMRQGLWAYEPKIYTKVDNMTLAGIVAEFIDQNGPQTVFIDAGRGEGVIDRLRQIGYKDRVVEVPFGGKAIKETRFVNKRSEMWYSCKEWLEAGGVLPYLPELRKELSTPEFSYDAQNRLKLQSKKELKEKTGNSPDIADALALTFAYPVNSGRSSLYLRAKRTGKLHKYGRL